MTGETKQRLKDANFYEVVWIEIQEREKRRIEILSGNEPITDQLCKEYKLIQNYIMPQHQLGQFTFPFFSFIFNHDNLKTIRESFKKKKFQK